MHPIFVKIIGLAVVFSCVTADFRQESINLHKTLRAKHKSPPLAQSKELDTYAQNWAKTMADTNSFKHSDGKYGENIWMGNSQSMTESLAVKSAINAWYDEVSQYDYNSPKFSSGTGHFTQVVWKDSKNVGIGVAKSSSGSYYVCANYDPRGNMEGQFPKNVLKP